MLTAYNMSLNPAEAKNSASFKVDTVIGTTFFPRATLVISILFGVLTCGLKITLLFKSFV